MIGCVLDVLLGFADARKLRVHAAVDGLELCRARPLVHEVDDLGRVAGIRDLLGAVGLQHRMLHTVVAFTVPVHAGALLVVEPQTDFAEVHRITATSTRVTM